MARAAKRVIVVLCLRKEKRLGENRGGPLGQEQAEAGEDLQWLGGWRVCQRFLRTVFAQPDHCVNGAEETTMTQLSPMHKQEA